MNISRKLAVISLMAGGLAVATVAMAGGHHGHCPHEGPGMMGAPWHGKHDPEKMSQHMTERLAALKMELKLTAAQQKPWDNFETVVKAQIKEMASHAPEMKAHMQQEDKLTAPERLAKMREFMQARLAGLDKLQPALQSLYDSLSPEQRKVMDAFRPFGGPDKSGPRKPAR